MASSSASVASRSRSSIGVVTKWPRASEQRRAARGRPTPRSVGAAGSVERRNVEWRRRAHAGRATRRTRRTRCAAFSDAAARTPGAPTGCCAATQSGSVSPNSAHRRLALALGPALPVERRLADDRPGLRQELGNGLEPLRGPRRAARPSGAKSRVTSAQHAEDRLAGPQRRIAVHEVAALVLGQRDLEMRVGEGEVDVRRGTPAASPARARPPPSSRAQRPHLVGLAGQARRRPVRQAPVVLVHAGEGGRHRPAPIERREESVERGRGRPSAPVSPAAASPIGAPCTTAPRR